MALGLGLGLQFRRNNVGGFNGLFDQFGYPAFGASMRLLGINYTGGLVRVRAFDGVSDQGTADVMPYLIGSEYWVDLNSTLENLDATATGRGLTTSDTLADLVDAGGANYDGFVTTWFDQSGNANDATQTSASAQPKIVDAGVLVEENGEPAILPDGVDDVFVIANSIGLLLSAFIVAQIGADAVDDEIISNSSGNEYIAIKTNRYVYRTSGSYNPFDFTSNKTYSLASIIAEGSSNPRSISCYENSIISTDSPLSLDALNLNANSVILGDGNDNYYPNKVQEIIIYNSDQSSNRTGIETNINNHYNIYP